MRSTIKTLQTKSNRTSCQLHGRESKEELGESHGKTLTEPPPNQVVDVAKLSSAGASIPGESVKWPEFPLQTPQRATPFGQTPSRRAKAQSVKPQAHNLISMIGLVTLLTFLAYLLPLGGAQSIICGQENWFLGFDEQNYIFQAMDSTPDGSRVVVGGKKSWNALLIAHDMNTGTTLNHFMVDKGMIEDQSYTLKGVLDLKMHLDGTQATALLKVGIVGIQVGSVVIVQFTLGVSTGVRVAHMEVAALSNLTEAMFLVRGLSDQIEFLFEVNNGDIWRYHVDFATGTYFLQIVLDDPYGGEISDAVVTPSGRLLMATKNQSFVRITRLKSDQTTGTTQYSTIDGNDFTSSGKLVAESDDIAYLVTKEADSGSVRLITLDTSDSNVDVVFSTREILSFTGDSGAVIQSVFMVDGEVEIIAMITSSEYVILNKNRLIRVTMDRTTIGGQPWVYDAHPLNSNMATTNGCLYGLGDTHVERLCSPVVVTVTTCSSHSITTTTETVSVSDFTDSEALRTVGSPSLPDSSPVEPVTILVISVSSLISGAPINTQLVNPCGVKTMPSGSSSFILYQYPPDDFQSMYSTSSLLSTIAEEQCPDPDMYTGFTSSTFQLEIVELIKPDATSLVPDSTMVSFDQFYQAIEFDQNHEEWVTGEWQIVYTAGFCTSFNRADDCNSSQHTVSFQVSDCVGTSQTMPTLSPNTFSFMQGSDTSYIDLSGAFQGNCPYYLFLLDSTSFELFHIQQATFQMQDPPSVTLVQSELTSPVLVVSPDQGQHISEFNTPPYYTLTIELQRSDPVLFTEVQVTILAPPCTPNLIAPLSQSGAVTFDPYYPESTHNVFLANSDGVGENGDCTFTYSIDSVSPTSLAFGVFQPVFDQADEYNPNLVSEATAGIIEVIPTEAMIGTIYGLQMSIYGESESLPFTVDIDVLAPECVPNPQDDGSVSTTFTFVYGETDHEISLDQFSDGDCAFDLEFSDTANSHSISLSYVIEQPEFKQTFAFSTSIETLTSPGVLKVTASDENMIGEHSNLKVTISGTTSPAFVFTINIEPPPCTQATYVQLPTFNSLYTVLQGDELPLSLADITLDGDCSYSLNLYVYDGAVQIGSSSVVFLTQTTFEDVYPGFSSAAQNVVEPSTGLILFKPTYIEHCNFPGESYTVEIHCTVDSGITALATFDVFVEGYSCVEDPVLPTLDPLYTYIQDGSAVYTIDLTSGSNGNCAFTFEATISPNPEQQLISVTQASFEFPDQRQPTIVQISASSQAQLVVEPQEISHISDYIVTVKFAPSGPSTDFTLTIIAPVCVPGLSLDPLQDLEFYADLETPFTQHLSGLDGDCRHSYEIAESHGGHLPLLVELHQPQFTIEPKIPTKVNDITPGWLKISPSNDLIGEHEYTLTLNGVQTPPQSTSSTFTVTIRAPPCLPDLTVPESLSVTAIVGDGEKFVDLSEIQNNNCSFELTFIGLTGQYPHMFTLDQPIFTQVHHLVPDQFTVEQNGKLRIATTTEDQIGFYSFVIHASYLLESVQFLVTVEVERDGICDPDLQLPDLSDQVIQMGTSEIILSLEGTSNGSCRFNYELFLTDGHQMADPSLIWVKQPSFKGEAEARTVNNPGSITITPDQANHIGNHSIVLQVQGQDGATGQVPFQIEVYPCEAIESSQEGTLYVLYAVGSGKKTQLIETANDQCPNSSFSFSFEENPQFLTVDAETLELTIETDSYDDSGEYSLTMTEQDNGNLRTSVTVFKIYVDTEEAIVELALKLAKMKSGNSTVADSDDQNDDLLDFSIEFFRRKFKYVPPENTTPEPLTAQIYDITKAGNLTIVFSKPIILPPIELVQESKKRQLQQEKVSEIPQQSHNYALQQVLTIYLESAFYDDDSKEIEVLNYNLTRLTPTALDVQIQFNEPQSITQSKVEPDVLKVDFKMSGLFIDKNDYQTFEEDQMLLEFPMVPQYSQERLEELEAIEAVVGATISTFSIGNLVLNSFLAFGLKYLWNMVTLLQFMIFMREWLISLPDEADIFLRELRSLALLEFLQKYEIKETVFGWFGIEKENNPLKKEQSLLDKLAVILLAGIVIVFLVFLLLCLRVCVKTSPRAKRCYESIKAKLFYNTFIRYVLLGTLKIQLTIGGTVFIGLVIPETLTLPAPETGLLVFGILVLTVMSLMPLIFAWVLYANKGNLDSAEIKSKIGALYFSLLPTRSYIGSYSVVFLVRRSIFVIAYFALRYHPSMQVEIMLYTTLLYICYISNMRFYESNSHRRIEIMNECILVGVCYHFVIFANPDFDIAIRHKLGFATITFVSALLAVNSLVIVWVSIAAIKRKLKLKKMKRQAEQNRAQQLAQKKAASVKNPTQLEAVVKSNQAVSLGDQVKQDGITTNIPIITKGGKLGLKQDQDSKEVGKLESFEEPAPLIKADLEQPSLIAAKGEGKNKKSLKMAKINTELALKGPKPAITTQIKVKSKTQAPPQLQLARDVGRLNPTDMTYKMQSIGTILEQHHQFAYDLSRQQQNGAISKRKTGPTKATNMRTKTKGKGGKRPRQNNGGLSTRDAPPTNLNIIAKPKSKLELENERLMGELTNMMQNRLQELRNE